MPQSVPLENINLENRANGLTKRLSPLSNKTANNNSFSVVLNKKLLSLDSSSPPHFVNNENCAIPNISYVNTNSSQSNQYRSHFQLSSATTNFRIMEKQNKSLQQSSAKDSQKNVHISSMLKNSTVMKDVTNTTVKTSNIKRKSIIGNSKMNSNNKRANNQLFDERSMSPLLYSSTYDTVTDAINNNSLLFAHSQSPCKVRP